MPNPATPRAPATTGTNPPRPHNLSQVIEPVAQADPSRAALVSGDQVVTYGDLSASVERAARVLSDLGLAAGGRLALAAPSSPPAVITVLAANLLGCAVALLNPALTEEEQSALLDGLGGVEVYVGQPGSGPRFDQRATTTVSPEELLKEPAGHHGGQAPVAGGSSSVALYLFTSGTTGLPKPVPITHEAMVERVLAYGAGPQASEQTSVRLMCVPLFHIGGLLGLLVSLWNGHTTVIQGRFDAGEWLALVERHRVEASFVVPTMLHRIVAHPDLERRDLSSLTSLAYGAAAAPVDLLERTLEALPHVGLVNTFGQTETLGGYTALAPGEHRDRRRLGSVGRPLPGVEVRVVEVGTDRPLPAGQTGEVLVRARQNVVEGWLRTGDLASMDQDGYLYPRGRLSDTINRGGEKFGPIEIEAVLRRHPAVEEAGVAALADPEMGERVGAVIVLSHGTPPTAATEEDLRRFAREHLAPFKVPERMVFVPELPQSAVGKVSRSSLARLLTGEERS